jgi:hypothetical protein
VDLDEASEANYRSFGYAFRVIDDIHDIYNCYYLIASQEIMKIGCFSLGFGLCDLGPVINVHDIPVLDAYVGDPVLKRHPRLLMVHLTYNQHQLNHHHELEPDSQNQLPLQLVTYCGTIQII